MKPLKYSKIDDHFPVLCAIMWGAAVGLAFSLTLIAVAVGHFIDNPVFLVLALAPHALCSTFIAGAAIKYREGLLDAVDFKNLAFAFVGIMLLTVFSEGAFLLIFALSYLSQKDADATRIASAIKYSFSASLHTLIR